MEKKSLEMFILGSECLMQRFHPANPESPRLSIFKEITVHFILRFILFLRTTTGILSYNVNVEEQNFLKGLEILREGLTAQSFTRKRLQIYVTKFFYMFPEVMKRGHHVANQFFTSMTYTNESNAFLTSAFQEYKITTEIKRDLENNEGRREREK